MRGARLLPALLLVAFPAALEAQGYLLRLDSRVQHVNYRGVRLDSILASAAVPGPGGGLQTSDGYAVDCAGGSAFCSFYRPGPDRSAGPLVTSANLTAWGLGLPRLSFHLDARLGVDLGTADAWPGTDPAMQLLEGYLEYAGDWFRGRAGRQVEQGRLGYTGFDGAAVTARKSELGLSGEIYGGLGLARGTALPVTSAALDPLDDFQPRQRQLVAGVNGEWQHRYGDVRVEYQREVDRDTRNFVSERVALSGTVRPLPAWRLSGGTEYDIARGEWGTSDLDLSVAQRRWSAGAGVRRYRPYFDLWTIWGVFSPVPYTAVNGRVRLSPVSALELFAGGEQYWYDGAGAGTPLVKEEDSGWRWNVGGGYAFADGWHAGGGYHTEFGAGAASRGWDAQLSWQAHRVLTLSADGGRMIRPLEFRYNESAVTWVGLNADIRPNERFRIGLGASRYWEERRRPDAGGFDWNQTRLVASLSWLIGSGADRIPLPPAVRRRGDR